MSFVVQVDHLDVAVLDRVRVVLVVFDEAVHAEVVQTGAWGR